VSRKHQLMGAAQRQRLESGEQFSRRGRNMMTAARDRREVTAVRRPQRREPHSLSPGATLAASR